MQSVDQSITFQKRAAQRSFSALFLLGIMVGLSVTPWELRANPTGGDVVSGTANISSSGNTLTVVNSNGAVINWQDFSIGAGELTKFIQSDANSTVLNRVVGTNLSQIYGTLSSNGKVFLINPNGVMIGATGIVNTAGFMASTLDINNADFIANNGSGAMHFVGNSTAAITNLGTINAVGGDVYLIAKHIDNQGTVNASEVAGKGGLVGVYATDELYLTTGVPEGGLVRVGSGSLSSGAGTGINNSGLINAVQADLKATGNLYSLAINNTGVIRATGASVKSGVVHLGVLGGGGKIVNSGLVDASGTTGGGGIDLLSDDDIDVTSTGRLVADATVSGRGGSVKIVSGGTTTFDGALSAKGAGDGKGGQAEISGGNLRVTGYADLSGPGGNGDLLFDPGSITIIHSGTGDNTNTFLDSYLNTQLGSANVTLATSGATNSAAQTLTLNSDAALSWTSASTLTLNAGSDIALNGSISASSGGLVLNSGGTITAPGSVTVKNFTLTSGNWVQNAATLPTFSAVDFRINGGSFLRVVSGSGTSASPYQVADVYGLQGIGSSSTFLAANWKLANNIDASGTSGWNAGAGFNPIGYTGTATNGFSGTFDGNNDVIDFLNINRPSANQVGLFSVLNGGTVQNLGLTNDVIVGGTNVGGIVGLANPGYISNVFNTGTVTGNDGVGGIAGSLWSTSVINGAYNTGNISGTGTDFEDCVGGIVGWTEATVMNAFNTGNISQPSSYGTGGIAGYISNVSYSPSLAHLVENVYNTGTITGLGDVGGVVGSKIGYVYNAYTSTGTVVGTDYGYGGSGAVLTSAQMLQQSNFTGFDFTNTWQILNGVTAPLLRSSSIIISGVAYSDAGITNVGSGISVSLYNNGALTTLTTGTGGTYNYVQNGVLGGGGAFLLTDNASIKGVTVSTTGGTLNIWGNTVTTVSASNSLLSQSNSSGQTSLYSASGNNITTASGVSFLSNGSYILDGNLTASGSGTIAFNGTVTLPGNASVSAASSISFSSAINAVGYTPTIISTSGTVSLSSVMAAGLNVGGASLSLSAGTIATTGSGGLSLTGSAAITGAVTLNSASTLSITGATIAGTGSLTLSSSGNITIASSISGSSGSLNIAAGSGTISDSGSVTVKNFTLTSGNWVQNTGTLPTFSANNFTINGGSFLRVLSGSGTTGSPYQVADVYGLQGIGSSSAFLAANWKMANNIDASGTTSWNGGAGFNPIGNSTTGFSGLFEGDGHSITGLTVNNYGIANSGLFGVVTSMGTLENVAMLGGSFGSYLNAGALVGINNGLIQNVYSTGTVNVSGTSNIQAGGIAGTNNGTIQQSYATGNISGGVGGNVSVGGLVGWNTGTVQNSYATGNVVGTGNASSGGLVGSSIGLVRTSYATGSVSGYYAVGGLVGNTGIGSVIADSYWDTTTQGVSGIGNNVGTATNIVSLTSTQFLQQSNFSALDFVNTWQMVNGVTAPLLRMLSVIASGTAYSDAGITPLSSGVTISAYNNGMLLGTTTTGAGGTYQYISNGFTSGEILLTDGGTSAGATVASQGTGLNIWGNTVTAVGGSNSLMGQANPSGQTSLYSVSGSNVTVASGVNFVSTGGFTLNGNLTTSGTGSITLGGTTAVSGGNYTATAGNTLTAGDIALGSNTLTLVSGGNMALNGSVSGTTGNGLIVNSGGTISDTGAISVGHFTLAGGSWVQNSATLPGFSAGNFTISGGSFLRVVSGSGTSASPYQVADVYGLQGVGSTSTLRTAKWALANDIDASSTSGWNSGAGFVSIGQGTGAAGFNGTLDGNGHAITGLSISNTTATYVGLVGYNESGGSVKNLAVGGTIVGGDNANVGVVGENYGSISAVTSTAAVTGGNFTSTGGLVGSIDGSGSVTNSHATGNVVAGTNSTAGGLVGYNDGTVSGSYSTGSVTGGNETATGGLIGINDHAVATSYATGTVVGGNDTNIGGLVGYNFGSIATSHATGSVSGGTDSSIGGLSGDAETSSSITGSYATGGVSGQSSSTVGGLVGFNAGTLGTSYATGSVTGTDSTTVGGLLGINRGAVTATYATGSASGGTSSTVGGLIGNSTKGSITASYSTGAVSGATLGGLLGAKASSVTVTASYWDVTTSGYGTSGQSQRGAVGETTSWLQLQANYPASWNFTTIWTTQGNAALPTFQP
ncbi:filamentous hemagglutinin family N-terminal domain-containing protein [Verrucomicrobium sp. GAS474]|uniref:filamentous hemagglutinin N-terminal domain-containing protein n=1 Tax=Verrucomicrobium sp. GAS474 TaxID=1882831 RepID=UPI00087A6145|nr:filamentous hemagglutinin N-terminal domain-containing protein [Verrucomicrobium sp. GAS474]SDT91733.1 filamentous hemagglutinin family N-terminal domain-containing protein [Verrucomicrobium sp. GAS474]